MPKKGYKQTEEHIERLRELNKGKHNYWLGKHLSNKHKENIRENAKINPNFGMKGKYLSKEAREKISNNRIGKVSWMKGKTHKKENKIKMSIRMKGNKIWVGRHHSKESKDKMRKARKNIIFPLKDTSIELKIQSFLSSLHIEFFTHKYISEINHGYQCDILIPQQETEGVIISQKAIIECDGCYWHGCSTCKPRTYERTEKRRELDKLRTQELIEKGYKVIRLWEHEIKPMNLKNFQDRLL